MARTRTRALILGADGDLVVERDPQRPSGRLLRQEGMEASYIDLGDLRHLEFDYLRWTRLILRSMHARHVLHVGGGGCALARALLAEDPGSRQEVFEVDERVVEIARAHLGLRRQPGLKLRVADGRAAISARSGRGADAIVIDAFVGARVPRHLVTCEALATYAQIAPLTIVNVVDTADRRDARAAAAALSAVYPNLGALAAGRRHAGNVVVFGSANEPDWARIEGSAAADASPARLVRARELTGGAPWRDQL